jgi:XTP/dITP diphosphohydrolase
MYKISFATTNEGKIKYFNRILSEYGIEIVPSRVEMPEPRSYDVGEIAEAKVKYASAIIKDECIALDSGFFIYALNGFPRTFVNFALDSVGINGFLKLMEGKKDRRCAFKSCLAYIDKEGSVKKFYSEAEGTVAIAATDHKPDYAWSDLYRIFIPKNKEKTLSEMSKEEYEEWSGSLDSCEHSFAAWFMNKGEHYGDRREDIKRY